MLQYGKTCLFSGVVEPYKPTNRYSVIQWTYFTDTHLYLDNELTNIEPIIGKL